MQAIHESKSKLVDVRSPDEYTGKVIAPLGVTEIRNAVVTSPPPTTSHGRKPSTKTARSRATRRSSSFTRPKGHPARQRHRLLPHRGASAHTWFVFKYLLGYPSVKNYDGSWTEWGNLVNAPITRGDKPCLTMGQSLAAAFDGHRRAVANHRQHAADSLAAHRSGTSRTCASSPRRNGATPAARHAIFRREPVAVGHKCTRLRRDFMEPIIQRPGEVDE